MRTGFGLACPWGKRLLGMIGVNFPHRGGVLGAWTVRRGEPLQLAPGVESLGQPVGAAGRKPKGRVLIGITKGSFIMLCLPS